MCRQWQHCKIVILKMSPHSLSHSSPASLRCRGRWYNILKWRCHHWCHCWGPCPCHSAPPCSIILISNSYQSSTLVCLKIGSKGMLDRRFRQKTSRVHARASIVCYRQRSLHADAQLQCESGHSLLAAAAWVAVHSSHGAG